MSNLKQKHAIKRLMQDLQELQNEPVENVSAQPLDDNMLEWHCNFKFDDTVFHLILFFPETYPFVSPSAEFVPPGYQFSGGATDRGKKGVKICLSIFSDFAMYHTEWANEKGMGWSPGYTVQTVLLNLLSFLSESLEQSEKNKWNNDYFNNMLKNNKKLAMGYTCKDCGHTHKKPYPPLEHDAKKGKPKETKGYQIVDYISKAKFNAAAKPKSRDDLFGYGLIVSGPPNRPGLTTPCEFLTGDSFYSMKTAVGNVHSMMKEEIKYFLPMFINDKHGAGIKETFEETMIQLAELLPKCNPKKTSIPVMVMKTIPNLMSATVVEFSKGTQHTSENHLCGYFALHRLFLWAVETYPELQDLIDARLQDFIDNDHRRTKSICPHIGEWLLLLTASKKYTWPQAATAYLSESWRRNVMWYVKDDAKLGFLDTDKKYRLEKTLAATAVSRKLLGFQVLFLDIAMPSKLSREQIIARYDANMGFPTDAMVSEMKEALKRIESMKTYEDWFKVLKLPVPSSDEIFDRLYKAVEFSINTNGYHWSFWKNQGDWGAVLKKYPNGTPGWVKPPKKGKGAAAADDDDDEEEEEKPKGKGKGKGKGKSSVKAMEVDEPAPSAKGKGRGKSPAPAAKGRGRGKRKAEEALEESDAEEEEEKPVKGRGRGGKKAKAAPKPAAAAKGRGKRKAEEPLEEEEEEEEAPVKGRKGAKAGGKKAKVEEEKPACSKGRGKAPAGRGRGRGRGKAK